MTTSLLTDRYELTMLASFVEEGIADRPAVFEVFSRRLPAGRRYGVVAGTGRLLALLEDFRFDADEVDWLLEDGVVGAATADYLRSFRFTGDVDGLREGDPYFPGTPVLTVRATLGEGVLLETLVLSVLNHDTAVASAATRMVTAAGGPPEQGGRPLIEMGSRRVHEEAAVAGARAAYLAGFAATSNLAAGHRYGVPTTGTAAHAFTLAHAADTESAGERAAFRAQVAAHGAGTTLLVDTYDIARGVRNAVAATRDVVGAATGPGAVRIDSGDLAAEARRARALLDGLGATDTRITVTSDLDEHVIAGLADAPVDGLGAGTRVATGSGHPTAGFVYKLVAVATADPEPGRETPMRHVAKRAAGKAGTGGAKTVWRTYDRPPADGGTLLRELHAVDDAAVAVADGEHVHLATEPLVRRGETVHRPSLAHVRLHTAHSLASLPTRALDLVDGPPAITPEVVLPRPVGQPLSRPTSPVRTLLEV